MQQIQGSVIVVEIVREESIKSLAASLAAIVHGDTKVVFVECPKMLFKAVVLSDLTSDWNCVFDEFASLFAEHINTARERITFSFG